MMFVLNWCEGWFMVHSEESHWVIKSIGHWKDSSRFMVKKVIGGH